MLKKINEKWWYLVLWHCWHTHKVGSALGTSNGFQFPLVLMFVGFVRALNSFPCVLVRYLASALYQDL